MSTTLRSQDDATSFLGAYALSKGPREVEEASDVIQRPLGYLLARLLQRTPVSPNAVTGLSVLSAFGALACFVGQRPLCAAAFVFFTAILDSTDGQLARMRKSASLSGRMLDGTADMVSGFCILTGATWLLVAEHGTSPWRAGLVVLACFLTALTTSFQCSMFDHYKNLWLRMTLPGAAEPDDWESALRRRSRAGRVGLIQSFAWATYVSYLKGQVDSARRYDPSTRSRDLPACAAERAAGYRREHAAVMRVWTLFFGFGTMLLGVAAASAFDVLEAYVVFRLLVLNAIFYGPLRAAQRRASRSTFEEGNTLASAAAVVPVGCEGERP
ncbi:MAG: CDP-alcohol phosphatidyltransferase family protein [Myxococcales bacterium]|nr:CDP-alcohol phosphatidyltransferase family protein [Myxococcales bacterium]